MKIMKMNKWKRIMVWLLVAFAILVGFTIIISLLGTKYLNTINTLLAHILWLTIFRYFLYCLCAAIFFAMRRSVYAKGNIEECKTVKRMGLMILGFCVFNEILVWI
ncbi:hypothetical protein [Actinobacillus delphinicola]|uniref:Uncharacterized protein n=1 Tax=Actinobacillus delphinicola TaxID=51161 RepID=A0A448TU05_9PAST|nr:hypothetical protein [Actinobacillus delphinicola]VEJ09395.1 Uncharacterised protein [Actinobacillus delphinicola]